MVLVKFHGDWMRCTIVKTKYLAPFEIVIQYCLLTIPHQTTPKIGFADTWVVFTREFTRFHHEPNGRYKFDGLWLLNECHQSQTNTFYCTNLVMFDKFIDPPKFWTLRCHRDIDVGI